jgi:SAM-dependent methyltransferase
MMPFDSWLTEEQLRSIYTAAYWNDVEEEKKKEFWIADGNYQQCLDYLRGSGLLAEYEQAESCVRAHPGTSLRVADLAAGIGWTSALLSRLPSVAQVHAVEISRHRLGELFECSARMLCADESKLSRHLGSFYDLHFEDESIDIVFMSQAFHHAAKPLALLAECDRVLRKGGRILLVGEPYVGAAQIAKRFMVKLVRRGRVVTDFFELFPPDEKLGDHYYRRSDYYVMFRSMGYRLAHRFIDGSSVMYVADKQ